MIELKPCPNCGAKVYFLGNRAIRCMNMMCLMVGPVDDPDGIKWNALPRLGDVPSVVPVVDQPHGGIMIERKLPETLAEAEAQLGNLIYAAAKVVESLQYAGKVRGNGHHARQKIAQLAVDELRSRWIGADAPLTRAEEYEEDNKRA